MTIGNNGKDSLNNFSRFDKYSAIISIIIKPNTIFVACIKVILEAFHNRYIERGILELNSGPESKKKRLKNGSRVVYLD